MALEAGSVYAVLGGKFMPTGFAQFDAAMKKSAATAAAAESQMGTSSRRSAAAMTALGTAAKVGAAAGIVAVGVAAASSVKKSMEFSKQMSELKAVTKASTTDMNRMSTAAINLGARTGVGATKAAQAMTELAKGGLNTEKTIGALKGTIALAQAGSLDLGTAAETVANALNMFKLGGEDATLVADSLANAANATTADVSFFAQGLAQGGAAAKAAGLDFQQTTVFLEAMAANGFKSGSDAGTSMKTALIQLSNPTAKAEAAAKKLGVTFFDQNNKIKPLPTIARDLGNAFEGMGRKQKLATAAQIAGTDGMRALLALADQGPGKLKDFADANAQTGTAAAVAAEKQNNLAGQLEKLKSNVESLQILIGQELEPTLKDGAEALNDFFAAGGGDKLASGLGVGVDAVKISLGALMGVLAGVAGLIGKVAWGLDKITFGKLGLGTVATDMQEVSEQFAQLALDLQGIDQLSNQPIVVRASTGEAERALSELGKMGLKPKIQKILTDGSASAEEKVRRLIKLGVPPKVAQFLTSGEPTVKQKIRALIALGIPPKTAKIVAKDLTAAGIASAKAQIASLPDLKTISINANIDQRLFNLPSLRRASGRRAGASEVALVGEGGGPEYVVDSETGRSIKVSGPTVMSLGAADYVIPTESKYRGRALGLIAQMAADMGLVGYAGGRESKKARERRKKLLEQRRKREDRTIGILDTQAGRYGTEMDTANLNPKGAGDFNKAKNNRLKYLKREVGKLQTAIGKTKRGSQRRVELEAKLADIKNGIARTEAEVFTGPPAADVLTGLSEAERAQIDSADMQIALAALTDGTGDDQAALAAKEEILAGMLFSGQLSGRTSAVTDVAGQLRSTRDELKSLSGAGALTADQQAQSDQAMNRERIAAQSAFIDRLVGATIGGGNQTLVFQSYVPPSPTEAKRLADYTVGGIGYQGGIPSSTERIGV